MTSIGSTARQRLEQNTSSMHHLSPAGELARSGDRLGHILGSRYRLELLLGKGAMGEVYRAMDLQRGESCAVKLVLPEANWSLQAQRRLIQEASVISRLYHPNVVEVRDFFQDSDGTYLIMELLQGMDLQSLLRTKGQLPLWRASEITRSVGSALQYAHEMGIIHRDISASNIFIEQKSTNNQRIGETVKVLDFGLAKLIEDYQSSAKSAGEAITKGIVVGTPAYLPPEAVQKNPDRRDPRSDQWSLGIVLFHMLAGRLPFDQRHPYQLYHAICFESPPSLRELAPNLPGHIYATVDKALSKSCDDRFASVKDFLRALDALPPLPTIIDALSSSTEGRSGAPSPVTIERSQRLSPPVLASLASEADGHETDTQRILPAMAHDNLRTVQYSIEELRALSELSRNDCDAVPAPVQDDMVTTRYLSSSLLHEESADRPLREQRTVGDTVSMSAEEIASMGLPGLTRMAQPLQATSNEAASARIESSRGRTMATDAELGLHQISMQHRTQDKVPDQHHAWALSEPEASAPVAPSKVTPRAVWEWLASEQFRTIRSNLLMMGIGVVLCIAGAWALGLFRLKAGHTTDTPSLKDSRTASPIDARSTSGRNTEGDGTVGERTTSSPGSSAPPVGLVVRASKQGAMPSQSTNKGTQISARTTNLR